MKNPCHALMIHIGNRDISGAAFAHALEIVEKDISK